VARQGGFGSKTPDERRGRRRPSAERSSSVGDPLARRRGVWRQDQLRVVDDVADITVVADEADLGRDANRLLMPDDFVAHEIKSALRLGLRIIPVLINDAQMPDPDKFPEEIRFGAWINAVELKHSRFEVDPPR
jgi:hypothetical protein